MCCVDSIYVRIDGSSTTSSSAMRCMQFVLVNLHTSSADVLSVKEIYRGEVDSEGGALGRGRGEGPGKDGDS